MRRSECRSLVELLRARAEVQPQTRGYVFLVDGDREGPSLTYGELDRRSRALAARLQAQGAQGRPVMLLYPPGLDFLVAFFGCLYAGAVAVPAYPPHPARPERSLLRLRAIARDCRATLVLTTDSIIATGEAMARQAPDLSRLTWQATEGVDTGWATEWKDPGLAPEALAFLQYTSGSTAEPRGVRVSHGNLLHNLAYMDHCTGLGPESPSVSWLPAYHDMGLIEGLLHPLSVGYPVYLMAPVAFLQRPLRWLDAISRYRAACSGGPNFAYDLCARKITGDERAGLDLSAWRVAYCGAEPVRRATLDAFHAAFAPCGFRWESFRPCYGLAEATLLVAAGGPSAAPRVLEVDPGGLGRDRVIPVQTPGQPVVSIVACGPVGCGTSVVIADPKTGARCEPDQVGEIWVASPSVSLGYWTRTPQDAWPFGASLADTGEGPFLRTGDLGFLHQEELYVTGRLKDLLIVRGRKHYPQDIEAIVEASHPSLRPGGTAVVALEAGGIERMAVLSEVDPRRVRTQSASAFQAVVGAIRQAVAEHHELQVEVVGLLAPGELPKTSSGKLRRYACRVAFRAGGLQVLHEWTA